MPTLLLNPQLLDPLADTVAVTWLPLMVYGSNPQPVAESMLPENSATTVMVAYPSHPESCTSIWPPLPQQLTVAEPEGAARTCAGIARITNTKVMTAEIVFR